MRRLGQAALATLGVLAGCGGSSGTSNPAAPTQPAQEPALAQTLVFSQSPIDVAAIEFVVPLGNLNPPDHTLPTDHVYFYHRLRNPAAPVYDVVAPAGGLVREARRGNDDVVRVQVTASATYYLGHVKLDPSIQQGLPIAAGQKLGTTSTLSYGLDVGLVNYDRTLSFVNPARYGDDTRNADSALRFFAEPVRSALYAKVDRRGGDLDGRIDFDVAGRLAGNWFLDGLPVGESTILGAGPKQLAFVRDVAEPDAVRISIGGTLAMEGVFAVPASLPDPANVGPGSGRVAYPLYIGTPGSGPAAGLLVVEMIDAETIRAEAFAGSQQSDAAFTPAAQVYRR
jgi:hypothetical protein